jgi:hypothetical protein
MTALLAGAPQAGAPSLEGSWELTRFDDVPPPEAPPEGLFNSQVVFSGSGTLQVLTPLQPEPSKGEYALHEGNFRGWLGLTNDPSGSASLAWATPDRFELTYPDGSVASFRRLSADTAMPAQPVFHCVPLTVRGIDYDADQVALAKRLLDHRVPATPPRELLGTWTHTRVSEGTHTLVRLTFGGDGVVSRCTVMRGQYPPASARASRAAYSVQDGHLLSELFACGDPLPFRVKGEALELHGGEIVLHRQGSPLDPTDDCK